jgi:hypothetical protein
MLQYAPPADTINGNTATKFGYHYPIKEDGQWDRSMIKCREKGKLSAVGLTGTVSLRRRCFKQPDQ